MNHSTPATSQRRWILAGLILTLVFNFAIRWHLRALPLERDEGEYAYAGQLILQGILPYKLAFNMKFPGTYFMYALLMAIFGQSVAGIHAGIILVTSLTALLVFFVGRKLMSESGALIATVIYVCLAALPRAAGLAGHATHFVSLFVCAGISALLMGRKGNLSLWWFFSGIGFGLAILMKQHAVFFPLFILVWFLWNGLQKETPRKLASIAFLFCAGCILPFLAIAIVFACAGLWHAFIFWTFGYARQYVSMLPLRAAPGQFAAGFDPVFESGIWVWIFGIAGLVCLGWRVSIFGRHTCIEPEVPSPHPYPLPSHPMGAEREQPPKAARNLQDYRQVSELWNLSNSESALPVLMFLAGLAATIPGFYFRNHYFLMAMPGLALLNAAFVLTITRAFKDRFHRAWLNWLPLCLTMFIIGDLLVNNAGMWFDRTPVQLSRELYPGNPFPESIQIADYLKRHTSRSETIAVLGSEPQIFFLSDRHSASGYIYMYSLTEPQPLAQQMGKEFMSQIETARPAYVVSVNTPLSWYSLITPSSFRYRSNIQDWWADYSTNYELAGAVKTPPGEPSQFFWNEESLNGSIATNSDVLIYRRKVTVPVPSL